MKIIRAEHLGMCFGVRDAINLALRKSKEGPLTILGELVHNDRVLALLAQNGVSISHRPEEVATPTAMITAHGTSAKALRHAKNQGLHILEATCPLVHFAHRAVNQLVKAGFHPVIIGKRDHVEVRGLTDDLTDFDVILSVEDVETLKERAKFGIAAQTTQPLDRVHFLAERIKKRFPSSEIRLVDTVCHPTKQRQTAAADLALASDVVIVIGGKHSNNTKELAEKCRQLCPRVYHVQSAKDLNPDWFFGAGTVGITAGTSTPDDVIREVEETLERLSDNAFEQIQNVELQSPAHA